MVARSVIEQVVWSWEATVALAWPRLAPIVGGYLIREMDPVTDMARHIDGYWITDDGLKHGVAVRCQDGFGGQYETFTIRRAEWRDLSQMPPVWGPRYYIQSYVSGDRRRLLKAAMAPSSEVLAYVDLNQHRRGFWRPSPDSEFAVVPWRDLAFARIVREAQRP